jgi:riboflavin synthase
MFTGIVEELGEVLAVTNLGTAARLEVHGPAVVADATPGASIAVNGVCLTAVTVDKAAGVFTADVMAETLHRSTFAAARRGDPVNLERAATLSTRLGGHLVQGHVDGVGRIRSRTADEHWQVLAIGIPPSMSPYLVEKGSVTVDGVSLTVVTASRDWFTVSLIPTTLQATTLGRKRPGDPVNLEADVVAKHVHRLLSPARHSNGPALVG